MPKKKRPSAALLTLARILGMTPEQASKPFLGGRLYVILETRVRGGKKMSRLLSVVEDEHIYSFNSLAGTYGISHRRLRLWKEDGGKVKSTS